MRKLIIITLVVFVFTIYVQRTSHSQVFLEGIRETLEDELEEGAVLGFGVTTSTKPYAGVDEEAYPIPLAILQYKRLFIDGDTVGFYLTTNEDLKLALIGVPRFWGYHSSDSPALKGMNDREWSIDGGLKLSYSHDLFNLNITGLTDLLNEHDGQEVNFFVSKEFFKRFLTPRVGVRWFSENLVNHYFGVESSESLGATRPAYSPEQTLSFVTGVTVAFPIGERWLAIGDIQYQHLTDEIEDSPIVDEDDIYSYVAGVVYRF